MIRLDELRHFARGIAGSILAEHEAADAMAAKIVGNGVAAPGFGEMAATDNLQSTMLGTSRVEPRQQARGVLGEDVACPRQSVIDPFTEGSVRHKRLAPAIEVMAPGIAEAAEEDLKLHRVGSKLPDAARFQPPHSVGRLDVAVDIDRLVEVEHAVRAPAKRMQNMVRVLGAEAGKDDAPVIGLAIAVRIHEVDEFGAVGDVRASVARLNSGGNEQTVCEDRDLVGAPRLLGVFEDEDLVV